MFIYQAVIMLVVVALVFVLAFVVKIRNRTLLFSLIVALVLAGSFLLTLIQDYFGVNKYYTQKVSTSAYAGIKISQQRKDQLGSLLKGYRDVSVPQGQCRAAYEKSQTVQKGKLRSTVRTDVLLFRSSSDAFGYFRLRQRITDDKVLLPDDPLRSRKDDKKADFHYLTSYIRSGYQDPKELLYVPSHIYYMSEVIIQDGDMVVDMVERANRPETVKNQVLAELMAQLRPSGSQ